MIKKSSLILLLVFSPFLSLFSQKEDVVKNYTLGCSALGDLTDDNIRLKFSYANIDIYSYVIFNNDFLVYNVKNKVGLVDLKNGLELDAFNFNDYKTDYSYIKGIKNIKIINDTLIHIGFFIKKDSTTKKLNDDLLFLKVKENRLTTYFIKNDLTNSFNPKLESFNTNGGLEVLEFDLQFDKYFYGYNYSPYWNNCTGIKDCKKYKYAASIYYKDSKDSSTKTLLETEYNNPKYATYSPLIYPVGNSLLCTFDIESRDSIIVFDKNLNILKRGNFKSLFENKLLIEEKRKILFYNFILDNKTKYIYIEVDSQDSIYRYNDFYKILNTFININY